MKSGIASLLLISLLGFAPPARAADAAPAAAAPQGTLRGVVDLEASRLALGLGSLASAVVELRQEIDGWAEDPRESSSPVRLRATTDALGRFSLSGLAPGFYTAKVRAGDARPLVLRGIKVEAERETVLPRALVIEPPIRLAVRLVPAADPWQRPWQVRVVAEAPRDRVLRVLAEATTDETGLAVLPDLAEGTERLEVRDGDGRTWLEQVAEIYRDRPELFASIDVVPVAGRLSHGGEALAARLSFGTTQGMLDIRMESGEDGRFSGYLPHEGSWPVEVIWSGRDEADVQRLGEVEVRRRPGKSHADLEIRIPPTELRGRVVANGEPVKDAGITVGRDRGPAERQRGEPSVVREALLMSDEQGRFRLRGVAPGDLWLVASRGKETSGKVQLRLEESSWPTEILLELEEMASIRGMVVHAGRPLPGARILALPTSPDPGRGSSYVEAATDADGLFELRVPASATRLDLLAAAPSLGIDLLVYAKSEAGWPSPLVALEAGAGTLRCAIAPASGAVDFSHGLELRKGGAVLRWTPVVRTLMAMGQLQLEQGEVLFHGLAPGLWRSCPERDIASCRSADLPAGGEAALAAPPVREPREGWGKPR